jgi:hypothetical protein
MDIHPLLLEGPNMESWKTFIPEMLNQLLSPSNVKDIIRVGLGKYIVTFNSHNTIIENLFRELYYDSARIVFSSEYVFDVSIADTTMHRYSIPSPFKTSAPYKMVMNPFILYKGTRSRHFQCEYSEEPCIKRAK